MIFRFVLVIVLLTVFVWLLIRNNKNGTTLSGILRLVKQYFYFILHPFKIETEKGKHHIIIRYREALKGLTSWLFLLMALSGFVPVLLAGSPLTGWVLILHVTVAPFFVLSLAAGALFFARLKQISRADLKPLPEPDERSRKKRNFRILSKITFWVLLLFSVPAVLSVILSMFPLFSVAGLEDMVQVHRYTVLGMFVVTVVFVMQKVDIEVQGNKRKKKKEKIKKKKGN